MTDAPLTLDQWLGKLYQADIRLKTTTMIADFKTAIAGDSDLRAKAQVKLAELNDMISVRGKGACAYSTKYRNYLKEALA